MESGKIVVALVVVLGLLVVAAFWRYWLNINPKFTMPPKELPSPNAYDFYMRAFATVPKGEPFELPKLDPSQVRIPKPGESVQPRGLPGMMPQPEDKLTDPNASVSEKKAVLKDYEKGLALLRQGFAYDYGHPRIVDFRQPLNEGFSEARKMARAFSAEASIARKRGDFGKAIQFKIDGLQLGCDTSKGRFIAALVGAVVNAIMAKDADQIVEHLSAEEARSAARRLEGILAKRVRPEEVFVEERLGSLGTLVAITSEPGWRFKMCNEDWDEENDREPTFLEIVGAKLASLTWSKRGLYSSLDKDTQAAVERAKLPYSQLRTLPLPTSGTGESVLASVDSAVFRLSGDKVITDLLLLQLALRAYKLEKGQYPATLSDLAPESLSSIPNDPFGTGLYSYKLNGDSYQLYSFGPDCKDDGGAPLNTRNMQKDSLGDIVAGAREE